MNYEDVWKTRYEQWLDENESRLKEEFYSIPINQDEFEQFCKEKFFEENGDD